MMSLKLEPLQVRGFFIASSVQAKLWYLKKAEYKPLLMKFLTLVEMTILR